MSYGPKIKIIRIKRGLTQVQLAEAMIPPENQPFIARLERGSMKEQETPELIARVAQALNAPELILSHCADSANMAAKLLGLRTLGSNDRIIADRLKKAASSQLQAILELTDNIPDPDTYDYKVHVLQVWHETDQLRYIIGIFRLVYGQDLFL